MSCKNLDIIIKNAVRAAKRDGYDQVIYRDRQGGGYGIVRKYPLNGVKKKDVIGEAIAEWRGGILHTYYKKA